MKTLKHILIMIVLLSLNMLTTKDALAHRHSHHGHSSVFIGIGGYYPWYGGYHYDHYYYRHFGWPHCWVYDYYPYEMFERPVIIERPAVIIKESPVLVQNYSNAANVDEQTLKLFASIRNKKAELLRQLQIGGKTQKIKAVGELAGLSYDDKVKEKLTDILLNDTDPDLRKEAAKAFGNAKNATVLSVLEQVRVKDSDIEVRKAADEAIKKIKG